MSHGILSGVEESIKLANYFAFKYNNPDEKKNNEAMTILFSEIVGSQAFSDYFDINITNIEMKEDQYGAIKSIITYGPDNDDYNFMPSRHLYEPPEYYDEDEEFSLRDKSVFKVLDGDHVFSKEGMEAYSVIKNSLAENPFFKEIFEWKGIDALMEKAEEFSYRGDIRDLEKNLDPALYYENGRRNYDSISLSINNLAKNSGLDYFSTHESGNNDDMILTGVKTPFGVASYVMFKDFEYNNLGNIKTLTSTGTATPLRERGLLKRSIDLALNEFEKSETDDFVMRTSPGAKAPVDFTKYMDHIFNEENKKGNTIFLQSQFNYVNLEKELSKNGSKEENKEKLRDIALMVHENLDRDNSLKYDNYAITKSIEELSKNKKKKTTPTLSM